MCLRNAVFQGKLPTRVAPRREGRPRIGILATRRHERALVRCFGGVLDHLHADVGNVFVFCTAEGEPVIRAGLHNPRLTIVTLPKRLDRMAEVVAAANLDVLYHWEVQNSRHTPLILGVLPCDGHKRFRKI